MKRDNLPDLRESIAQYRQGNVWCGICSNWRPQAEAQRQFRTPSAWVFVCNLCFEADDRRERRVAPEAVHAMATVKLPEKLGALWALMMEEDDA